MRCSGGLKSLWRSNEGRHIQKRGSTLRSVLGVTQKQLAGTLGVSVRTVIRHERGQCMLAGKLYVGLRELELAYAEKLFPYLACKNEARSPESSSAF